ncbi:MAG: hypothetical protein AAGE83_05470, partial [Pseudomonadota bacterium]
ALAAREWTLAGLGLSLRWLWHSALALVWRKHREHPYLADRRLRRALARKELSEIVWDEPRPRPVLRAAE